MGPVLSAKRLELLKEALPRLARVLLLIYPADPIAPLQVAETRKVADKLGVKLLVHEVRNAEDFAPGLAAGAKARAEAVMFTNQAIFFEHRDQLGRLFTKQRLPSIGFAPPFADAGMLMTFGTESALFDRRTDMYVERILKGAKPVDLPVEQPTTFLLVLNKKVAKVLGLKFPDSFMVQVDRVVE